MLLHFSIFVLNRNEHKNGTKKKRNRQNDPIESKMNLRNRSRAEESWLAELGWREKTKRGRDGEVKTEKKGGGGVGEGSV